METTKTWFERINRSNAGDKEKEEARDFLGQAQKWAQDMLDGKVDAILQCDQRLGFDAGAP